mmetsp:Transcript_1015/g.2638  ORF Transcript_1015/g.2638 Transcript_1015/m.2638 type:complete len:205 (-) Transcript_1015:127-741(-)
MIMVRTSAATSRNRTTTMGSNSLLIRPSMCPCRCLAVAAVCFRSAMRALPALPARPCCASSCFSAASSMSLSTCTVCTMLVMSCVPHRVAAKRKSRTLVLLRASTRSSSESKRALCSYSTPLAWHSRTTRSQNSRTPTSKCRRAPRREPYRSRPPSLSAVATHSSTSRSTSPASTLSGVTVNSTPQDLTKRVSSSAWWGPGSCS